MICIRSGLEAIRVKRARGAVARAVGTFDGSLANTLGKGQLNQLMLPGLMCTLMARSENTGLTIITCRD